MFFKDKSLMLIFSYAPAGFGHLRVTDALLHGLPKGVSPVILGAQDKSITIIHRIASIHPAIRKLMEIFQSGFPEEIFSRLYKFQLRNRTKILYEQMKTLLEQRLDRPKTVIVVSTHFGLAHQFASIKKKLEQEEGLRVMLFVQVTDDSPQKMWYVSGADAIYVPSEKTKRELEAYAQKAGFEKVKIEVVAYPVSPILGGYLPEKRYHNRLSQLNIERGALIHIAIPISGAAVGTKFFIEFIDRLSIQSTRFKFHIIVKIAPYTESFVNAMRQYRNVDLKVLLTDREVVDEYEALYRRETISLEVTKPSEQSFKALINPSQIGGSILLFSDPVGRQEYDNLDFLRRHFLIPSVAEQKKLWHAALKKEQISLEKSTRLRGLQLPDKPKIAAEFVFWCLKEGIFSRMGRCKVVPKENDPHKGELHSNGVREFWHNVERVIKASAKFTS